MKNGILEVPRRSRLYPYVFYCYPSCISCGRPKVNSIDENQRTCTVLAYAIRMKYTFEQVKALFSEHDHFAIAIPESRKERNIFQLNKMYIKLLQEGAKRNIRICDYPEMIEVPEGVLELK